jgi:hypothetical protein
LKAIRIFNGEGIHSIETCVELSRGFIERAKTDRDSLKRLNTPKWFLSEIYSHLKKSGELPDLPEERQREIWEESKPDKLLAFSLYLIDVL